MSDMTWQSAGLTNRGLKRLDNQDNYFISADERFFVVADGVGGETGGALASRLTVETVETIYVATPPDLGNTEDMRAWMVKAVGEANVSVKQAADASTDKKGMGTTIVMAVLGDNGVLHVAHAGDSRVTLVRAKEAKVLTTDHSVVMEMHLRGQLTLEQCAVNPYRNLITRCLGHEDDVEVDYGQHNLENGDWFVLCSDGLSEVVKPPEIASIIGESDGCADACEKLLAAVLEGGAPDNVTIITVSLSAIASPVVSGAEKTSS